MIITPFPFKKVTSLLKKKKKKILKLKPLPVPLAFLLADFWFWWGKVNEGKFLVM